MDSWNLALLTSRQEIVSMRNYSANLKIRADSSIGRALPLQGRGHRFDPCSAYQLNLRCVAGGNGELGHLRSTDSQTAGSRLPGNAILLIFPIKGAVVQPGLGRQIVNLEVAGSNPVGPASFRFVL